VLTFENLIRSIHRHMFAAAFGIILLIWLSFAGYAINHALSRQANDNKLRDFYVAVGPLLIREISTHSDGPRIVHDEIPLQQFLTDAKKWEHDTSQWLNDNLGPEAKERFVDMSSVQPMCWSDTMSGCEHRYDMEISRLVVEKRNLSAIIETSAYNR